MQAAFDLHSRIEGEFASGAQWMLTPLYPGYRHGVSDAFSARNPSGRKWP